MERFGNNAHRHKDRVLDEHVLLDHDPTISGRRPQARRPALPANRCSEFDDNLPALLPDHVEDSGSSFGEIVLRLRAAGWPGKQGANLLGKEKQPFQ